MTSARVIASRFVRARGIRYDRYSSPRGHGRLAQLVARFLHTEEVIGSSPVSPTQSVLREHAT